jgi:hypothetical protein
MALTQALILKVTHTLGLDFTGISRGRHPSDATVMA